MNHIKKYSLDNMQNYKDGWLVGRFSPALHQITQCEVAIKKIKKGFKDKPHIHRMSNEYNVIISGKISLDNGKTILKEDDIFIFQPFEYVIVDFLKDTTLLVIRNGSFTNDKVLLEANNA